MTLAKRKMMAEVTMELSCGGMIKTYLPCKGERDLLKKLRKRNKKGWCDFGHFGVDDESVMFAGFRLHEVN